MVHHGLNHRLEEIHIAWRVCGGREREMWWEGGEDVRGVEDIGGIEGVWCNGVSAFYPLTLVINAIFQWHIHRI